jgi:hypothetical protein
MGKIVKYCSSCDEGFAERFGFCPVCGGQLQAFELNPVTGEAIGDNVPAAEVPETHFEAPVATADSFEPAYEVAHADSFEPAYEPEPETVETPASFSEQIEDEPEDVIPATAAWSYGGGSVEEEPAGYSEPVAEYVPDDDYHVTVIEDKNNGHLN